MSKEPQEGSPFFSKKFSMDLKAKKKIKMVVTFTFNRDHKMSVLNVDQL